MKWVLYKGQDTLILRIRKSILSPAWMINVEKEISFEPQSMCACWDDARTFALFQDLGIKCYNFKLLISTGSSNSFFLFFFYTYMHRFIMLIFRYPISIYHDDSTGFPFFLISLCIPFFQLLLGLLPIFHPRGLQFNIFLLTFSAHPYHINCLVLILSSYVWGTFIISVMRSFTTIYLLELCLLLSSKWMHKCKLMIIVHVFNPLRMVLMSNIHSIFWIMDSDSDK